MKLELIREEFTDKSTIGSLLIDGKFYCHVIEDKVRNEKIFGETAIPYGSYQILITYSPRFKQDMPLLINVPGYTGVRIHWGNRAEDTEGCLIVGKWDGKTKDFISESKKTYSYLFNLLKSQNNINIVISQK